MDYDIAYHKELEKQITINKTEIDENRKQINTIQLKMNTIVILLVVLAVLQIPQSLPYMSTFPRETYNEDLELMGLDRAEGYKEGQKDTAKQIFAELESIKDEYDNPLLDTLYGKGEQYKALKKKYKVD